MIGALKIFLAKHPTLRVGQRKLRKLLRRMPLIGGGIVWLERNVLWSHARERYDVDDPSDAHEYFQSYATWVLPRVKPGAVLDLGCGYGFLTKVVADQTGVRRVVAIDKISPQEFRFLEHQKITYRYLDLTKVQEFPEQFDIILATEFIEHIDQEATERLLGIIAKSLAPGGVFLGSTPNGDYPSGSPFHVKEYSRQELESILKNYFSSVKIELLNSGALVWEANS